MSYHGIRSLTNQCPACVKEEATRQTVRFLEENHRTRYRVEVCVGVSAHQWMACRIEEGKQTQPEEERSGPENMESFHGYAVDINQWRRK